MKRKFKNPIERSKKISEKLKGKNPWNKGKKLTPQEKAKQNLSGLELGRGLNKGKTGIYSEETLKKMSEAKMGHKYCVGRKYTQETIEKMRKNCGHKMSELNKQKARERMKGNKHTLGYVPTEETKLKMAVSSGKRIGELSANWQGGITPINLKIRNSKEIKLWRVAVFERDNYICQKYGNKGKKLVAHHIKNFSSVPEFRTSIENGITLSEKAHCEFHKIYGKKNNTREQLSEFLNN